MVVVSGFQKIIGTKFRGKLGHFGDPDPKDILGIYQVKTRWPGRPISKQKFYVPANPQTVSQQANRVKFAAGIVAWQALTPAEKVVYNKNAIGKHMTGFNLFLRQYMLT